MANILAIEEYGSSSKSHVIKYDESGSVHTVENSAKFGGLKQTFRVRNILIVFWLLLNANRLDKM